MTRDGLDDAEWRKVIDTLEKVAHYYDRMNNFATFFQAEKWRKAAAEYSNENLDVLEVGCGPGTFAKDLKARRLVCLDPSEKLLSIAKDRIGNKAEFVLGEAENIKFGNEQFDRVFCSFSYRDFKDQKKSLGEFYRVLKKDGILVILDIANHGKGLRSLAMNFHIRYIVPMITRILIPRKIRRSWDRNPYLDLWDTYRDFKTPKQIADDVRISGFKEVEIRILSLGGAFLVIAKKS